MISKHSGEPRYLHPHEAAHLFGLPASVTFAHDPRACLALLGSVASPLQVIWIYGHLRLNHAKTQDVGPHPSVTACLSAYCQELLVQYEAFYGAGNYPQPSLALEPRESVMHLRLAHAHHQVQQLLELNGSRWTGMKVVLLGAISSNLSLRPSSKPWRELWCSCSVKKDQLIDSNINAHLSLCSSFVIKHHVGLVQLAPSSWRSLWTCNSLLFARSSPCRGLSYIQTIDSGILWFCKS